MKFSSLFVFLFSLGLLYSCSKDSDGISDGNDTPQKPESSIFNSFVEFDLDKTTVTRCDTAQGKYTLSFSGSVPTIQAGNVVVVSTDTMASVVLVTDARTSGNTVNIDGVIGDLSYIFTDTEFTLSTDNNQTRSSEGNVYYPKDLGTRASIDKTIWSGSKHYTSEFIKTKDVKVWTESNISSDINATIKFKFKDKVKTTIQGITFVKAKKFDVDVSLRGNVTMSQDFNVHAIAKGEVELSPKDKDKYALLKHNFFPPKEIAFQVGPVPVFILFNSDLYADVSLTYDAKIDFSAGITAKIDGSIGAKYDGTTGDGLTPYNTFGLSYETRTPTLTGEASIEGKLHVFPRIRALIYNVAGPSFDIKPYLKTNLDGAFNISVDNRTDNYISSSLKNYIGLDCAVGLSASNNLLGYETWNKSTDDINIAEFLIHDSPVDIIFKEAKPNGSSVNVSFEVYDKGLFDTKILSPLFPVVKFETYELNGTKISGDNVPTYALAKKGIVTVEWTPKKTPSKIIAKNFDKDGNVIASDEYEYEGLKLCPDNHHPHAIDLGLPSGTKWCCMNVGASSPEQYGGYYAWGETSEKSVYNEVTYSYYNGQDTDGDGLIDKNFSVVNIGSDIAGTSYDVAHVRMGGSWRMPSSAQQVELMINCTRTFTQQNGVYGILVTGNNGGQLFLPAAGYRWDSDLYTAGSNGIYWSSSLRPGSDYLACSLYFDSGYWHWSLLDRVYGHSVRAVCP